MKRMTREELIQTYPELNEEPDENVIELLLIVEDLKAACYLKGYRNGYRAAPKELMPTGGAVE